MALLFLGMTMMSAFAGRPATDPSTWVRSDDYPKAELNRGINGATGFRLLVSKDGSVDDCEVIASSGSDALDATACALLKVRARFIPAHDATGHRIAFVYSSKVVWQIPGGVARLMPSDTKTLTIAVDISPKGVIDACTVVQRPKEMSETAPTPCVNYPVGRQMLLYTDAENKPIGVRMTIEESVSFTRR